MYASMDNLINELSDGGFRVVDFEGSVYQLPSNSPLAIRRAGRQLHLMFPAGVINTLIGALSHGEKVTVTVRAPYEDRPTFTFTMGVSEDPELGMVAGFFWEPDDRMRGLLAEMGY